MNWEYKNTTVTSHDDLHEDCQVFVYELTYADGRKYIGKKQVRAMRRKKPTKKQLSIRKNYKRVEMTNLPFANYEGSLENIDLPVVVKKEILYQCSNKISATYMETALLFKTDAVISKKYLNRNIMGKFFDNATEGVLNT